MDYSNDAPQPQAPEICEVCEQPILTMTWRGTGVCGDEHRKTLGKHKIMGEDRADKG